MVESSHYKRSLIIAPSWVGDMVMAQSLLKALKLKHPEMEIDVLAPAWCSALTDYMPEVDQLIEAPFQHKKLSLLKRWKLAKQLRGNYDVAYVLPNSLKSALVPFFARIPMRIGFIGEQRYGLLNKRLILNKKKFPLMVQRFIALSEPDSDEPIQRESIPLPELKVNTKTQTSILKNHSIEINLDSKILILCPGAEFGSSKQWPAEHFSAVARFYIDQGWQVWLMGSENDKAVCQDINSMAANECNNLAGTTSLDEAVVLMSVADLVISNDSGLMHIAASLQKPLIAVYGSTDPSFTPPLHDKAKVISLELDCSPCFKRNCPLKHLNCLKQLQPSLVLESSQALMKF